MPKFIKNQRGFTLVELMISMLLGLIVIGGVITVFTNTVAANSSTIQTTRLNQEMRSIMEMIGSDLRRAGYFRDAHCTTAARNLSAVATADNASCSDGVGTEGAGQGNPFSTIEIGTNLEDGDCILFRYDYEDSAGTAATPDGILQISERYGYKRDTDSKGIGFISRRFAGAACETGGWRRLSNPAMSNITDVIFDSAGSYTITTADGLLSIRSITITISGQLASDPAVSSTLRSTVSVSNDRYCPGANCLVGI
ncbi:hypothetical protein MNBD_GAMMA18-915 [hydrothermal vent metagenome]|uniref:Type IV fimbrial biogenesis protein PilW n=1 Tax=hydrothermal vent metagenome TaxID=652676 RepID=A0A3B0YW12_9ZZZZ